VTSATESGRDGPPRSVLIAAVAVAVAAIVAVLAIAAIRQSSPQQQPVPIVAVPAPKADGPDCRSVTAALPEQLGDYRRVPAAEPAPAGAAAWQAGADTEPVVLRCGVERPEEFVVGTPMQVVDAVQWFEVAGDGRSTWFAVDRPVYIALTLPAGSGPTPIQEISELVGRVLPARPIDPGPPR
jgi:predicted lipid-binding transport protein (Tim44 family)